jgi:hypothetical protein
MDVTTKKHHTTPATMAADDSLPIAGVIVVEMVSIEGGRQ